LWMWLIEALERITLDPFGRWFWILPSNPLLF
jgi:hypothetical protein